jgi:3-oxoacyl-[acyl-carrier protein] reductase
VIPTALVTGAAGGIGRAVVERLVGNGYFVHALSRTSGIARREASDIGAAVTCSGVQWHEFDLSDASGLAKWLREEFPNSIRPGVIVHCAGVAHGGLFQATRIDTVRDIFQINFFAPLVITQHFVRRMVRDGGGRIVFVASIAGIDLSSGNIAYGTSKAGLIAATRTMAAELAQAGIRVNAVAPGLTRTSMADLMEEKAADDMLASSASGRMAEVSEVVDLIEFLLSEKSAFINGQCIRIDGGKA